MIKKTISMFLILSFATSQISFAQPAAHLVSDANLVPVQGSGLPSQFSGRMSGEREINALLDRLIRRATSEKQISTLGNKRWLARLNHVIAMILNRPGHKLAPEESKQVRVSQKAITTRLEKAHQENIVMSSAKEPANGFTQGHARLATFIQDRRLAMKLGWQSAYQWLTREIRNNCTAIASSALAFVVIWLWPDSTKESGFWQDAILIGAINVREIFEDAGALIQDVMRWLTYDVPTKLMKKLPGEYLPPVFRQIGEESRVPRARLPMGFREGMNQALIDALSMKQHLGTHDFRDLLQTVLFCYGNGGLITLDIKQETLRHVIARLEEAVRDRRQKEIILALLDILREGERSGKIGQMMRKVRALGCLLSWKGKDYTVADEIRLAAPNAPLFKIERQPTSVYYLVRWMLAQKTGDEERWETLEALLQMLGGRTAKPASYPFGRRERSNMLTILEKERPDDTEATLCARILKRALQWHDSQIGTNGLAAQFQFIPVYLGDELYLLTKKNVTWSATDKFIWVLVSVFHEDVLIEGADVITGQPGAKSKKSDNIKNTLLNAAFSRLLAFPAMARPQVLRRLSQVTALTGMDLTAQEYAQLADSLLWNSDPEVAAKFDQNPMLDEIANRHAIATQSQAILKQKESSRAASPEPDPRRQAEMRHKLARAPVSRINTYAFPDLLDEAFQILGDDFPTDKKGLTAQVRWPLKGQGWGLETKGAAWALNERLANKEFIHTLKYKEVRARMTLLKNYLIAIEQGRQEALNELLTEAPDLLIVYLNSVAMSLYPVGGTQPEELINRLKVILLAVADQDTKDVIDDIFELALLMREACSGMTLNLQPLTKEQQRHAIQNLGAWGYAQPLFHTALTPEFTEVSLLALQWCETSEDEESLVALSEKIYNGLAADLAMPLARTEHLIENLWCLWYGGNALMALYHHKFDDRPGWLPDFVQWWQSQARRLDNEAMIWHIPVPQSELGIEEPWYSWPRFLARYPLSAAEGKSLKIIRRTGPATGYERNYYEIKGRLGRQIAQIRSGRWQGNSEDFLKDLIYLALNAQRPEIIQIYAVALEAIKPYLSEFEMLVAASFYDDAMLHEAYLDRVSAGRNRVMPVTIKGALGPYLKLASGKEAPTDDSVENAREREWAFKILLRLERFGQAAPGFTGHALNELFSSDNLGQLITLLCDDRAALAYMQARLDYGYGPEPGDRSPLMDEDEDVRLSATEFVEELLQRSWRVAFLDYPGSRHYATSALARVLELVRSVRLLKKQKLNTDEARSCVALLEREGLEEVLFLTYQGILDQMDAVEQQTFIESNLSLLPFLSEEQAPANQKWHEFQMFLKLRLKQLEILRAYMPALFVPRDRDSGKVKSSTGWKQDLPEKLTVENIDLLRESGIRSPEFDDVLIAIIYNSKENSKILTAARALGEIAADPNKAFESLSRITKFEEGSSELYCRIRMEILLSMEKIIKSRAPANLRTREGFVADSEQVKKWGLKVSVDWLCEVSKREPGSSILAQAVLTRLNHEAGREADKDGNNSIINQRLKILRAWLHLTFPEGGFLDRTDVLFSLVEDIQRHLHRLFKLDSKKWHQIYQAYQKLPAKTRAAFDRAVFDDVFTAGEDAEDGRRIPIKGTGNKINAGLSDYFQQHRFHLLVSYLEAAADYAAPGKFSASELSDEQIRQRWLNSNIDLFVSMQIGHFLTSNASPNHHTLFDYLATRAHSEEKYIFERLLRVLTLYPFPNMPFSPTEKALECLLELIKSKQISRNARFYALWLIINQVEVVRKILTDEKVLALFYQIAEFTMELRASERTEQMDHALAIMNAAWPSFAQEVSDRFPMKSVIKIALSFPDGYAMAGPGSKSKLHQQMDRFMIKYWKEQGEKRWHAFMQNEEGKMEVQAEANGIRPLLPEHSSDSTNYVFLFPVALVAGLVHEGLGLLLMGAQMGMLAYRLMVMRHHVFDHTLAQHLLKMNQEMALAKPLSKIRRLLLSALEGKPPEVKDMEQSKSRLLSDIDEAPLSFLELTSLAAA